MSSSTASQSPAGLTAPAQKSSFVLFESRTRWYLIGGDRKTDSWRVLTIDRTNTTELVLFETPEAMTFAEVSDWIDVRAQLHASTGGVKKHSEPKGLLGFIKLPKWTMVIASKAQRQQHALFGEHTIYELSKTELLPVANPLFVDAEAATTAANDETLLHWRQAYAYQCQEQQRLFKTTELAGGNCYFSRTLDLTKSIATRQDETDVNQGQFQDRFLWNYSLMQPLLTQMPNKAYWVIPLVQGFLESRVLQIRDIDNDDANNEDNRVQLTLMARRSRHFAGTRFLRRGIELSDSTAEEAVSANADDSRGLNNVANEVESEVVLYRPSVTGTATVASLVLLRGSIPLTWGQVASTMSTSAPVVVGEDQKAATEAAYVHFLGLAKRYGAEICMLNLIRTYGSERTLGDTLEKLVEDLHVRYAPTIGVEHKADTDETISPARVIAEVPVRLGYCQYDMLSCKADGHDVMVELTKQMHPIVESMGITVSSVNKAVESKSAVKNVFTVKQRQDGVMRVNCIDCLDRTNLAQFILAKLAMPNMLKALFPTEQTDSELLLALAGKVLVSLTGIFTLHGDRIAWQYAGSGAMHKEVLSQSLHKQKKRQLSSAASFDVADISDEEGAQNSTVLKSNSMLDALVLPDELPVVTSQLSGVADNLDSSLTRYYKNNFTDRDRQLGFDLLHGKEVSFEEGEFTSRKSKRHQPYIAYATAPNNNNNNNTADDSKKQSSHRRPSHVVGFFDRYMLPHEQCVRDMRYGLQLRKMVPGVLFTMTRSKNKNVVVYATKDATQVSITEPVDDLVSAYWLKVDTGDEPSTDLSTPPQDVLARRRSLSYLESMTSYGLCDVWSPLDSEDRSALVPSCTGDSAASALTPASLLGSIRFTLHMLPPHYVVKLRILSNGHTVAILCNGHNQDFPQDCQIVQMYVNETERFFATPKINSVSFLLRQLQSSDFKEQVPSLGDIVEPSEAPKSHMFFVWRYEAEIAHDRSDESFKLLYSFTKATTPFAFIGQPSNKSRKNSLVMNNSIKKRKSKTSTIAAEESAVDISNNITTDGNTVEPTDADLSQDEDGEASDSGSEEDDGAYLSMSRIPRTHISAHVV